MFKKALFLIKISKENEGKAILKRLIKKNSNLKVLSEEIISKQ